MASGDLTYFEPGERVSVTLVADSSGNVAGLNDLVEITGQNSEHTEVSVVENAGAGVASLARLPREYDEDTAYAAGDEIGEATVLRRHPVDWLNPSTADALAAGDVVVSDAGGGVAAYDSAGGDTADMVLGPVWTTLARGNYTAGKVAVVRQR